MSSLLLRLRLLPSQLLLLLLLAVILGLSLCLLKLKARTQRRGGRLVGSAPHSVGLGLCCRRLCLRSSRSRCIFCCRCSLRLCGRSLPLLLACELGRHEGCRSLLRLPHSVTPLLSCAPLPLQLALSRLCLRHLRLSLSRLRLCCLCLLPLLRLLLLVQLLLQGKGFRGRSRSTRPRISGSSVGGLRVNLTLRCRWHSVCYGCRRLHRRGWVIRGGGGEGVARSVKACGLLPRGASSLSAVAPQSVVSCPHLLPLALLLLRLLLPRLPIVARLLRPRRLGTPARRGGGCRTCRRTLGGAWATGARCMLIRAAEACRCRYRRISGAGAASLSALLPLSLRRQVDRSQQRNGHLLLAARACASRAGAAALLLLLRQ
jgi:hypothetical protein